MLCRRIIAAFAFALLLCGSASWAQDQQPGQVQGQQPGQAQDQQPGQAQDQQPGQAQGQQPGQAQDQQPGQAQGQQPDQPQDNAPQAPIAPVDPNDAGGVVNHQLPAPAARALFGTPDNPQVDTAIENDDHPLTGAEAFGLGSPTGAHDLFDLALHLNTGADTGIVPGQTDELVSVGGLFDLNHMWSRYVLKVQYAGAEDFYHPNSTDNSAFQNFSVVQTVQWRRVTLLLRDDFGQSAGAAFGGFYTGGAFFTAPEGLVTAVTPAIVPNQTILTGQIERLSNLSLGEVEYAINRRSALTFGASYGFLHFLTSGEIDSQNEDGRIGYGYELDRKNILGLVYDYSRTSFSGANGTVVSDVGQAAYGRKLTGRTAIQVSAGPEFVSENVAASNVSKLSWSMNSVIKRHVRRTEFWASYNHGVTNGSGVLLGAHTDTVTGFAETTLFRTWLASLTAGYAANSSLLPATTGTGTMTPAYSDWFSGLNVSRLWDRMVRTNFNYGLQRQITNTASCPVLNCGSTALRQVVSVTIDFHLKPIGFE